MGNTDLFKSWADEERSLDYSHGYNVGKGVEIAGEVEYNEYVDNKYESSYIDGFMVGLGERNNPA